MLSHNLIPAVYCVMSVETHPVLPLLKVQQLSVALKGETVIHNLSFQLHAGERVCLLGASGSGKSLTARAIAGFLPATAVSKGEIFLLDEEILHRNAMQRTARSRVACMSQDSTTALNPLVKIGQQFALVLATRDKSALQQTLQKMNLDDIPHLLSRYPGELSGGQRQRVCLAFALLSRATLLVADEPTTALDVMTQQQVLQQLQQFTPLTLLFITHDIAIAAQLCQRALVMQQGRIVEQGSMRQLLHAPQHPYTQALVASARRSSQRLQPPVALVG